MSQERRVAIVSDSTSSLSPAMGEQYGVHIMPIYVTFGTQTYRDGVDLGADEFYRLLQHSSQPPTTAQPTVADFVQVYTALAEQVEAIVSIHASIKMTATADAARAATKALPDVPIHVIDTQTVSMGLGLLAIAAAHAAAAGQDAAQVVEMVERLIPKVNLLFTVNTMEYLYRGGRIGGATALIGTVLNIKPILQIINGQVEPVERPRTRKRALERLLDLVGTRVGEGKEIHAAVLHCNAAGDAEELAGRVAARFSCRELITSEAGPTIGTHGGPGTVGVVFYPE
jgi:DegV family protein with EDD domain